MTFADFDTRMRTVAETVSDFTLDCAVIARRNLIAFARTPKLVVAALLLPLMFVVLFTYILGPTLGGSQGSDVYRQFVMGGIITLTIVVNGVFTALRASGDRRRGMTDRFESMPISRFAPVVGRMVSDVAVNVASIVVMVVVGEIIGWRFHGTLWDAIVALVVLLFFGCAVSAAASAAGAVSHGGESTLAAYFVPAFPVGIISSALVATSDLPGPLRALAEWNPVTTVIATIRLRAGNPMAPDGRMVPVTWAAQHATGYSLVCTALFLAAIVPVVLLLRARR